MSTFTAMFGHRSQQTRKVTTSVVEIDAGAIKRLAAFGFAIQRALRAQQQKEAAMLVVLFKPKSTWKIAMARDARFAAHLQYQRAGGEPLRLLGRVHEGIQLTIYRTKNVWKFAMARDVQFTERLAVPAITEPIRLLGKVHDLMKLTIYKPKSLWKVAMVKSFSSTYSVTHRQILAQDSRFASRLNDLNKRAASEPILLLGAVHDLMQVILYKPKNLWKIPLARDAHFPSRLQYPTDPFSFIPFPYFRLPRYTPHRLRPEDVVPPCGKEHVLIPPHSDTFGDIDSFDYHVGMEKRLQPILEDYEKNFVPNDPRITPGFRELGCTSSECPQKEGAYDYFTTALTIAHCHVCGDYARRSSRHYAAVIPELAAFRQTQEKTLMARMRNMLRKWMGRYLVKKGKQPSFSSSLPSHLRIFKIHIRETIGFQRQRAMDTRSPSSSSDDLGLEISPTTTPSPGLSIVPHEKTSAMKPVGWRDRVPARYWTRYEEFWGDNAELV